MGYQPTENSEVEKMLERRTLLNGSSRWKCAPEEGGTSEVLRMWGSWTYQKSMPPNIICFNCNGYGHIARQCPSPKKNTFRRTAGNVSNVVETISVKGKSNTYNFLIDTGAYVSLICNELIKHFKYCVNNFGSDCWQNGSGGIPS
eukprot:TRINITY_DN5478_c0_g2_i1.p1 TRINITY_DN5478_c0_g2~~TRINITY_DN5478_c0_g2_i1.p1  ORF type:complete len:145 (-),score=9.14 TRINITY_DN5478_c0_g2_i1:136-570(-)